MGRDMGSASVKWRETGRRGARRGPLRSTALALVTVGLLAAAPAGAFAAPPGAFTFVHSADSGELQGGRLTLRGRGIGRRVTWVHNSGRSGVVSVARMHRGLFTRGTLPATGVLQVAGRRPGRELALRLSRPRVSVSGHWVSYRVKRLTKRRRAAGASQAAMPRRFEAASLSLVGGPRAGGKAPLDTTCSGALVNHTQFRLQVVSAYKWPTDSWELQPTIGQGVPARERQSLVELARRFLPRLQQYRRLAARWPTFVGDIHHHHDASPRVDGPRGFLHDLEPGLRMHLESQLAIVGARMTKS